VGGSGLVVVPFGCAGGEFGGSGNVESTLRDARYDSARS
jgi:hypothetical protein